MNRKRESMMSLDVTPHNGLKIETLPKSRRRFWTLGFSLSVFPLLAWAERVYRNIPQLSAQARTVDLPSLSIIVPARNEAQNLRRLLPSLETQDYPGEMEIIIVDDHSTDGTLALVECRKNELRTIENTDFGVKCVAATPLAEGWLGKPNASHTGACSAKGEWLLFTDADTEHEPSSASSAVAFAQAHNLDGLSIFPQQATRGLLDSAVLMVAFVGLFAGLRSSTTMLNGQYILLRREVYEASGGFAAVRSEMMDDLAFGRLLAEQGYQVPIMRGESLASVYMYGNRRQMWHGVNRLGSGSLRHNGIQSLIPAIFVTGLMIPLWTLLFNRRYVREIPGLWLIWLTATLGILPWANRFNRNLYGENRRVRIILGAIIAPIAALFVQLASLWGMLSRLLGWGVSWKDRKV